MVIRKKIKRRCREMKMGAQIRTGKRLPDTGKRFRDRIRESLTGVDLYPPFHFQITVELPRLVFFLILTYCAPVLVPRLRFAN